MKNWFNEIDRRELLSRLDRLAPTNVPRWGKMTPQQVVCHLADPVRLALGEKEAKPLRTPFGLPGIAFLIVWVLPWPRGAPTAPEFLPGSGMTDATGFEDDRQTLLDLLLRLSEFPGDRDFGPSPVFGSLSRSSWGRLVWRHLDHHLRQFGL